MFSAKIFLIFSSENFADYCFLVAVGLTLFLIHLFSSENFADSCFPVATGFGIFFSAILLIFPYFLGKFRGLLFSCRSQKRELSRLSSTPKVPLYPNLRVPKFALVCFCLFLFFFSVVFRFALV